MAENTIKTRIQLKNDTEANWKQAVLSSDNPEGTKTTGSSFKPKKGEAIIFSSDSTHPFSRLKIGDGITDVLSLPFIDSGSVDGKKFYIDSTASWNSKSSFIPNEGDIIIYTDKSILSNNTVVPGIKIGDGLAYCIDLPFIAEDIATDLLNHINNTVVHITAAERTKWNNKITCEDTVAGEILILTRN